MPFYLRLYIFISRAVLSVAAAQKEMKNSKAIPAETETIQTVRLASSASKRAARLPSQTHQCSAQLQSVLACWVKVQKEKKSHRK